MRFTLLFTIALLGLLSVPAFTQDEDIRKERVLVVLDNLAIKDSHSLFFSDLQKKGYKLDFKVLNHDQIQIQEFGEYLYDQLILFCTSVDEPKFLNNQKILEFFDSGRNIIIAGDVDSSRSFRSLVNQFGVDYDQYGSKVYDDVAKAPGNDHSLFFTPNQINQPLIAPQTANPLLYRGIGLALTPYENFQTFAILRGAEYTYSKGVDENGVDEIIATGTKVILAAGVQGRNNARALITGSLDVFSNELYAKSKLANQEWAIHVAQWAFNEAGVLRVNKVFHHFAGDASYQPGEYKLLDDIVYDIDLTLWDPAQKKWVPYVTNDVIQLEFFMLDPYVRMPLTPVKGTSIYRAEFKIPDKHGVFQFKVTYRKPGVSFVVSTTKIPVRPFKHNEYERFLFEAFPYYITVFATLVGFYVFVVYFLFDSSKAQVAQAGKKE